MHSSRPLLVCTGNHGAACSLAWTCRVKKRLLVRPSRQRPVPNPRAQEHSGLSNADVLGETVKGGIEKGTRIVQAVGGVVRKTLVQEERPLKEVPLPLPEQYKKVELRINYNKILMGDLPPLYHVPDASGGANLQLHLEGTNQPGMLSVELLPDTQGLPSIQRENAWVAGGLLDGLRIPGGIEVALDITYLVGQIDILTGRADNDVVAEIYPALNILGHRVHLPKLTMSGHLTTDEVEGRLFRSRGKRATAAGDARLVGIVVVHCTGNWILDQVLLLPAEALVILDGSADFVQSLRNFYRNS